MRPEGGLGGHQRRRTHHLAAHDHAPQPGQVEARRRPCDGHAQAEVRGRGDRCTRSRSRREPSAGLAQKLLRVEQGEAAAGRTVVREGGHRGEEHADQTHVVRQGEPRDGAVTPTGSEDLQHRRDVGAEQLIIEDDALGGAGRSTAELHQLEPVGPGPGHGPRGTPLELQVRHDPKPGRSQQVGDVRSGHHRGHPRVGTRGSHEREVRGGIGSSGRQRQRHEADPSVHCAEDELDAGPVVGQQRRDGLAVGTSTEGPIAIAREPSHRDERTVREHHRATVPLGEEVHERARRHGPTSTGSRSSTR